MSRGEGGARSPFVLRAARLFTGEEMLADAAVVVAGPRVRDVVAGNAIPPGLPETRLAKDLILAPGFIDAQVNGGGGVLFNDAPSAATLRTMVAAHRRFGATSIMPTLITDTPAKMRQAAEAVRAGVPGVVGLHLEGPFLNPARKGVHPEALIRPIEEADIRLLCDAPRPLLLTLAPECVGAATIARLVAAGVIVAVGHSAASFEQVRAALDAGARGFTHLFNAMPPLAGRDPGVVGAALLSDAFAGVIADGHHVHGANLRLARLGVGKRLMLVTDAMASVGSDLAEFRLHGRNIRVADGRLTTEDGVLAGAHLDMAGAVRGAMALMGASLPDALRMAAAVPADFLGLADRGRLRPGAIADMVAITDAVAVSGVWVCGRRCGS